MSSKRFSVVSMFSGIGGLDMGFEGGFAFRGTEFAPLGFDIIAAYEKDPSSVITFRQNHKVKIYQHELTVESPRLMPRADVLIGGFPCQDFSSCGPKRGLESDRGQLYKVMTAYMREHRPLLVCAENVPNLARMRRGEVLLTIMKDFENEGYRVEVWNLFAPDHGIPQNRRRLFFVCVRDDMAGMPQEPPRLFRNKYRPIEWAIGDLVDIADESVPNQSQYFKASRAKKGNGQGDETSIAGRPAYTVRANAKSRVQYHYALERRLTVRECARIQTFPDTFVFPHSPTTSIMQIGNAVPPILAYEVAKTIHHFLEHAKPVAPGAPSSVAKRHPPLQAELWA
jgi:DNA (cytosine-5)-methyltransferase 1